MKIKDIKIEVLVNIRDMECYIKDMINDGWHLFGPLSFKCDPVVAEIVSTIMVKYEEEINCTNNCGCNINGTSGQVLCHKCSPGWVNQERKLVDFSINWYPTLDSMDRNEKEFISEGWETFKRDSVDHNTGLMTHKLMMVKYEN